MPPLLAVKLLQFFAGKAQVEDIKGDLDEVYLMQRKATKKWKADLDYWWQVASLIFSHGLRERKKSASYSSYYHKNSTAMFKNYFTIAVRNFAKHRLFTTLNVIGLALGMSICLIALSATVTVYNMDEFHTNKERIFQINTSLQEESNTVYSSTFYATGGYLKANYPIVDKVIDIQSDFEPKVYHEGHELDFSGYYAGKDFFEAFSFSLLKGNDKTALQEPFTVVLTAKTAKKLYGYEDPLGKTIKSNLGTFKVTGVMQDLHQTHFYFEMLASYPSLSEISNQELKNDWQHYRNHYAYVMLNKPDDLEKLDQALGHASVKAAAFHSDKEISLSATEVSNLLPFKWYKRNQLGVGWEQRALFFFIAIGILMLLPAIFNHTNLSIARSLKRAKEIGIRKVIGAQKKQIKAQFIIETVLMTLIALLAALVIMVPIKQGFMDMVYFTDVVDTSLTINQVLIFVVFAVFVGLFTGYFPAQYFARLTPNQTLKGEVLDKKSGVSGLKKGLFVFQFFVSLVFIIGVAAISKQYAFVLNNNHGFQSENVLTVPFFGMDKRVALKELSSHQDIKAITSSSSLPGLSISDGVQVTSNDIDTMNAAQVFFTEGFIQNMGMELLWGESKITKRPNQLEEQVLVNQSFIDAVKVFNNPGDTLRFTLADGTRCSIVGILKDFNFEPLDEVTGPLLMRNSIDKSRYALLTVGSSDIKKTLFELEEIWNGIDQKASFQATFLDDEIKEAYSILVKQLKFFSALSVLAITISCLGLLGMATYTAENRTKEIAVRKIMGATNNSLYFLLSKDFLKLIGIATLLAIPFSYVFYDKFFLYALIRYGSGLGAAEVVVSILFLFLVGIASIYWQTAKVTKANPATKLRYE